MTIEEPAQPPVGPSVTRGFLFSDLRGYTRFMEDRGAQAAAALLDRYRILVREAVGRHQGAEIKTEGDSFYVVFPSVSSAVRCGIDIVDGAREATLEDPTLPVQVGVGVHAGETVETVEGYVGTPVNVAARICAIAEPGELLVSDTVRALTGSVLPVRFTPRGRRQLKGVAEPVAVYRVDMGPSLTPVRPEPRSRGRLGAVAALLAAAALVVVGIVLVLPGLAGKPPATAPSGGTSAPATVTAGTTGSLAPPTAAATTGETSGPVAHGSPIPLREGALPAGTYRTQVFQPGMILRLPDGWSADAESADYLSLRDSGQPDDQLTFHRVARATSDGCYQSSQPITSQATLHDWLSARKGVTLGSLIERSAQTTGGGPSAPGATYQTVPAWQVDAVVDTGVTCDPGGATGLYVFPLSEVDRTEADPAKRWLFLRQGQQARFMVATLPDGEVTAVARTLTDAQYTPFLARVDELVSGLSFVVPPGDR